MKASEPNEPLVCRLEPDVKSMTRPVVVEDRLVGPSGQELPSSMMVGLLARVLDHREDVRFRNAFVFFLAQHFFPMPVHPTRWLRVRRAASERASECGTSASKELVKSTASALCQIEIVTTTIDDPFERKARRQVNELVTRDFLGDDWRRTKSRCSGKSSRARVLSLLSEENATGLEERILNKLHGEELTRRAGLTSSEALVVAAHIYYGYSLAAIAAAKGVQASTVRNQFSTAMRKYRAIFDGRA